MDGTQTSDKLAEGVVNLYVNIPYGNDFVTPEMARADTENYIDLMDPTSLSGLNVGSTARAGEYRYGTITWYYPLKVTAEVPMIGQSGVSYKTKDGEVQTTEDLYSTDWG